LALFFLPFALLQYHSGAASDRTGRFLPIVGGSLGYGVIVISVGVAPVYAVAAGLMVVLGVCGAFMAPATMALVTDLVPQTQRGAAMGLFNVFGSLGFLTGFLVGGVLTDIYGYLPAFVAVGSLELTLAVVALPAVRRLTADPGPGMTPAD
jgi:Major Facilitator Superfamily.